MALTNEESSALMGNTIFRGRVKMEGLKYADGVLLEPTSTPAHNTRVRWANDTFRNPDMTAQSLMPVVVIDPAVQAAPLDPDGDSSIDDATLAAAVQAAVNKTL